MPELKWCPYPDCGFNGTDDEVDEHRVDNHRDEAQEGSNLSRRPVEPDEAAAREVRRREQRRHDETDRS